MARKTANDDAKSPPPPTQKPIQKPGKMEHSSEAHHWIAMISAHLYPSKSQVDD
ncbi:unnamed protein product [Rhodiola kirilowii]